MRRFCPFLLVFFLPILVSSLARAQDPTTENVLLITIDGLRWQEVFGGANADLINNEKYTRDPERLRRLFWIGDSFLRRELLLPFLWSVVGREGQIYGNRSYDSYVNVTNNHWFSYPGYSEILTGFADARIDSNDKIPNPNKTVLEFVNRQPGFRDKVAAFGSWDVFPYIVNEDRSGVLVNAGFEPASDTPLTDREIFLNELQQQVPSPWSTVRLDAFTHHYAIEYLQKRRPRLLYIAYGETDDFAHDGDYDAYLTSAHQTDAFIKALWLWVQNDPDYRNKTTFIIASDHGRGTGDDWTGHGTDIKGADAIWIAFLGPDTSAHGEVRVSGQLYQDQIAKTVAAFLRLDYSNDREVGDVIESAISR